MVRKYAILGLAPLIFVFVYYMTSVVKSIPGDDFVTIKVTAQFSEDDGLKIFYAGEADEGFSEVRAVELPVIGQKRDSSLMFFLPAIKISQLRLDLGSNPGQTAITIKEIEFIKNRYSHAVSVSNLGINDFVERDGNQFRLRSNDSGYDPYVIFNKSEVEQYNEIAERAPSAVLYSLLITLALSLAWIVFNKQPVVLAYSVLSVLFFVFVSNLLIKLFQKPADISISFDVLVESACELQVFIRPPLQSFSEELSEVKRVPASTEIQHVSFTFPDTVRLSRLRIDFGSDSTVQKAFIDKIRIQRGSSSVTIGKENLIKYFFHNDYVSLDRKHGWLRFSTARGGYSPFDPYIVSHELIGFDNFFLKTGRSTFIPWALALVSSVILFAVLYTSMGLTTSLGRVMDYGFMVAFAAVLLLPGTYKLFGRETESTNIEKRKLAERPKLDKSGIAFYPVEYENYYNDNFGLRNVLISLGGNLKAFFRASGNPSRVLVGKDNWLIFLGEHQNTLKDIRRENLLDETKIRALKKDVETRLHGLDSTGIRYYKAIWPDKHMIYPEVLPVVLKMQMKDTISRTDQLYQIYRQFLPESSIIDVRVDLQNAKATQLYLKNDTHWNSFGAFIAYQALFKTLSRDFPGLLPIDQLSDYKISWEERIDGDLVNLMGMTENNRYKDYVPVFTPINNHEITALPVDGYPQLTEHYSYALSQNQLRVLVFRDSYSARLIPFMAKHFKESLFIWAPYNQSIVDQYKPDLIIEGFVARVSY